MKQVVAFLLGMLMLVSGLVPQNDLTELSKLPQLLEHYRYHRTLAQGQLSPLAFLALHYGPHGTDHRQHPYTSRDAQDHHSLPLDQHHHDCVMVSFVLPTSRVAFPAPALAWPTTVYRAEAGPLYAFSVSNSLLQPPRA
ncbi:hypothetical protein SAMN06265337_1910 [Hymenobacter gelipurpurascens]|uniref:Uncharacterized protein n=1 Tax=Hymenobacter gelipurpurascens TaxID=89968 RepID=A0A212TMQ4_9BACT|nr:hypothetical protein [Hymenobacter gelipurpurascens]SNC67318.1 hypothetical protein SAMN06265337_1910 [Hymenobacter gelipurpurascens]